MKRRPPAVRAAALLVLCLAGRAAAAGITWEPLGEPGSGGAIVSCSVSPWDSKRLLMGGDMLGVGLSTDAGDSWRSTFGFKSWEMASFTWHPTEKDTVWVGSMSGPYKSVDGGKTWAEKRGGMPPLAGFGRVAPIEAVLFDPADAKRLIALGGSSRHWDDPGHKAMWGAVWESADGGETWKKIATVTKDGSSTAADAKGVNFWWAAFAPDGQVMYGLADGTGLLVSTDRGRTWAKRGEGIPAGSWIHKIAIHPKNSSILWAATGDYKDKDGKRVPGSVYKSVDGGTTWKPSGTGLKTKNLDQDNLVSRFNGLAVAPTNPDVLYVCDTAWNTGVLYKSEDGGATWRAVATKNNIEQDNADKAGTKAVLVKTAYFAGLAMDGCTFDPRDEKTAYFFNGEFLVRTRDGGQTFDDATSAFAGKTDFGDAWRGRGYSGLCAMNVRFNPYKADQCVIQGMDAARCWLSNDNLKTWTYHLTEPNPWFAGEDAAFTKDGHVYVTCGQYGFWGIGRSADGGKTWTALHGAKRGLPELRMGGGRGSGGIFALPDDPKRVWAVTEGKLYTTRDGGETWKIAKLGNADPHRFAGDPADPKKFYASTGRNVYMTADAGETFAPIGGPHTGGRMAVDAKGRLLVAAFEGQRGGVWRYDGAAWARLLDEGLASDVAVDPTDPNRLLAVTNMNPYADVVRATGVWVSGDGGASWAQANDGLAMTRVVCAAIDPHHPETLVVGTMGRGFFKGTWPKAFTPAGTRKYASTKDDATFAKVDEADTKPLPIVLRNGDMGEGDKRPANWDNLWTGAGKVEATRDTTTFRSKPAALKLASVGGPAQGQVSQMVDNVGGRTVVLAGAVKSAGKVKVNVAVQSYDGGWKPIAFQQAAYAQNDTDWTNFTKKLTLPEAAAHAGVLLFIDGDGAAWLDDVTLAAE